MAMSDKTGPERSLRVAAVQFEARDGDKTFNLARIEALARAVATDIARADELSAAASERSLAAAAAEAAPAEAEGSAQPTTLVCFHECCVTGYSFLQTLDLSRLLALAETVPGPTTDALGAIAKDLGVAIGSGLLERQDGADGEVPRVFNSYVVVGADGAVVACQRKLQPFVNPHVSAGDGYNVFSLGGFRMSVLICYDNNIPENVRCTALLGAEVVLMPHVTGGTPSPQPGRGAIDRALWDRRAADPVPLRLEFRGLKGREWIQRFIPCRAWENGVFAVFTNAVGVDHDTVKPGCSCVFDPNGNVLAECDALGDGYAWATLTSEALRVASGGRYIRARRPELYAPLVASQTEPSETRPAWARSWEARHGAGAADEPTAGAGASGAPSGSDGASRYEGVSLVAAPRFNALRVLFSAEENS